MHIFILAGGFATRLWPLTEKRAKPLLPLAGKPIIEHAIEQFPEDTPITVSINSALKEGFEKWKNGKSNANLSILVEDTENDDQKLGALGAVAQWIKQHNINDDVLLLTGDNYFGFPMEEFIGTYTSGTPLLAAYDIKKPEYAKAFGTVILDPQTRKIKLFEEKPAEPKTTLVSTGCSILPKETLGVLTEFAAKNPDNVGGIFEEFLRKNINIDCYTFEHPWFDIGSFEAYLEATKTLVGNQMILGEDASCEGNTFEGSVIIGAHSNVKNSTLKNVVVFDNCYVTDCILEDCIIDNGSILEGIDLTGKMLRENTVLKRK